MKTFGWFFFLLILAGVIHYGWARTVLLVLLVGAGLFIGSATACGIWETITKRRPAKTTSVIEQSRALAGRAAVHQDDEIAQLRRMAGLDT